MEALAVTFSSFGQTPRHPALSFPVGDYILEEMMARGWTTADVVKHMGVTDDDERVVWALTVDLLIHCSDQQIIVEQETADRLSKAFGTSPELWMNLNRAYQEWRAAKIAMLAPEREQ